VIKPVPKVVKFPPLMVDPFNTTEPPLKASRVPFVVPLVLVSLLSITSVPPLEASMSPKLVAPALPGLMVSEFPTAEVALTTPPASLVKAIEPSPMFPDPETVLFWFSSELPPEALIT